MAKRKGKKKESAPKKPSDVKLVRPGLLVAVKTKLHGGPVYEKSDVEQHEDGAAIESEWKVKKRIENAEEVERAVSTRAKAAAYIRRACIPTAFGLLCPSNSEEKLRSEIARAREIIDAHNDKATTTRIDLAILMGRVADTDEEAVQAILWDIKSVVGQMQGAIKECNVDGIRAAARQAKAMGRLLTEDQEKRITEVVQAARTAASDIYRRVEKNAEDADSVLLEINTKPIDEFRFAYLDVD